jgi:hypothetical protein
VTVVLAVLLGFLAGLLSFKVKSRWCSICGAVKSCPRCAGWAGSVVSQGLSGGVSTGERSRAAGGARAVFRGAPSYCRVLTRNR